MYEYWQKFELCLRLILNATTTNQRIRISTCMVNSSEFSFPYSEKYHPQRPRGSQSGREKRRDASFQVRAKEPLGTDSHRTVSKTSSGCRLLIGHKKCLLFCSIGEQFLPSCLREFVHAGYCLATLARFVRQACASKGNFYFLLS